MLRTEPMSHHRARWRLRLLLSRLSRVGLTAYLVPMAALVLVLLVRADLLGPATGPAATRAPNPPSVGAASSSSAPMQPTQPVVGTARVLDGDTLDLAGHRIRLYGIDAPESRQICQRQGRSYGCGREAQR